MAIIASKEYREWGFLLLFIISRVQFSQSFFLNCTCTSPFLNSQRCSPDGGYCIATHRCYFQRTIDSDTGNLQFTHGCYNVTLGIESLCFENNMYTVRRCCDSGDHCNDNIRLPPMEMMTSTSSFMTPTPIPTPTTRTFNTAPTGGIRSPVFGNITIAIPVVSVILIVTIVTLILVFIFLLRKRKRRIERIRNEEHKMNGNREPSPMYSPYSLDTLDLADMTCTSGSGSGEPLLTQRTIARQVALGEQIGSGRFGQVFVGNFQGDSVAVKKFASRDEKSWFRESEIYNTVLLRHDNILGFFASDVFSNNGVTELWLITQYHPHGSLHDYLIRHTISPKIMMRMAISTCKGLTHLHTEFAGTSAKPAIAHRDIKSRNILVKNNRECCIADFGLAVMKGPKSDVNFPTNSKQGTKRYMAPEILAETINMSNFESFKKVDIYAFGLVLWEICKRCGNKNDAIGEYELPFHGLVGQDPTFEEMKKVVVIDRRQPTIPSQWHNDELLRGMVRLIRECWYFDSAARNNAIFYKTKLYQLAEEDKIEYDDHE